MRRLVRLPRHRPCREEPSRTRALRQLPPNCLLWPPAPLNVSFSQPVAKPFYKYRVRLSRILHVCYHQHFISTACFGEIVRPFHVVCTKTSRCKWFYGTIRSTGELPIAGLYAHNLSNAHQVRNPCLKNPIEKTLVKKKSAMAIGNDFQKRSAWSFFFKGIPIGKCLTF